MMICVKCGSDATKGSLIHPYCKKCYKKLFNNDYNKYLESLKGIHLWE